MSNFWVNNYYQHIRGFHRNQLPEVDHTHFNYILLTNTNLGQNHKKIHPRIDDYGHHENVHETLLIHLPRHQTAV